MGTFCIFFGVVILFAFTGLGVFAANEVVGNSLYMSLIGMSDAKLVYIILIGACFFVGLLICLNLVMHGMNYNKLRNIEEKLRRRHHHHEEEE